MMNELKSRLRFKERWPISRVNNPKTLRVENTQSTRFTICGILIKKYSINFLR